MQSRESTGLQQTSKGSRKGSLRVIVLALLLGAMMSLLLSSPTWAHARELAQPEQAAGHLLSCPAGQIFDVQGQQCVNASLPAGPSPTYQPPNKQIKNPIANNSPLLFFTPLEYTVQQGQVQSLWGIAVMVVDACLALTLVLNGIGVMLSGSAFRNAKIIEGLPGVLLALIAAHVSMLFMTIFLNMNNVLSTSLFNWADSSKNLAVTTNGGFTETLSCSATVGGGINVNWSCTTSSDGQAAGSYTTNSYLAPDLEAQLKAHYQNPSCSRDNGFHGRAFYYNCTVIEAMTVDNANDPNTFTITPTDLNFANIQPLQDLQTLGGALGLMVKITSLMLIAQIVVRIFYLDLYIVLAPIALACWALPGRAGQPMTRSWFKGFLSTVFVQFMQVLAIIVTQVLLFGMVSFLTGTGKISDGYLSTHTLVQLLNVAILWFVLRVPALLNVAPMRGMMEVGQTMTQAANTVISMQIMQAQENASMQLSGETMGAGTVLGAGTTALGGLLGG